MKKVFVVLMVCLMATATFAATNSWVGPSGSWGTGSLWGLGHIPNDTDGEMKILKSAGTCTLDVAAGTFSAQKLTLGGSATAPTVLSVVDGGSITTSKEIIIGSGTGGGNGSYGNLVQTGGSIVLNSPGKLEVGYKSGSTGVGTGTYTISGGSLSGTGTMYVGAYGGTSGGTSGAVGTFTVQGAAASVSVGNLFVGVGDATGIYTGTANMVFNIVDGAVSAISTGSVCIDPTGAAVTNLLVGVTGAVPTEWVVIINNTGAAAVNGVFDSIPAGMTVSYTFDAGTMTNGGGNDVAVLVPEPATIALLSIGLLAIRRKK